jgi:aspartyl-tRNA(Asn)/glutamyl-tRNA(Gln) amidotransferase subunit A
MELYKLTAHELRDMLRKKEVSSVEITKSVLERMTKVEPLVESYITTTQELALKLAEAADKKLASGENLDDLTGIPYALKDNICTDGILTTCASHMLYNFIPPYDAHLYENLQKSGCVLMGKANMDEYAMGSSTEHSYFQTTKNPYDLTKVPGGSSGGSAAAVAADECIFAIGSDTGGSIRQPASFCSIVGMKPTYGIVSRFGVIALASSLDQAGPLTKDIEDCALVMNVISGHARRDGTSLPIKYPDYRTALVNDIKGLRIGLPKEYFAAGIAPDVKKAVLEAAETYRKLGATVEECSLPRMEYALSAYYIIMSAEGASNLARYDGIEYGYRAENYTDLNDLYMRSRGEAFGDEVKRRIMLGTYALSSGYYDAYYKKAQQVRTLIKEDFEKAFARVDVILTPTVPNTAWTVGAHNEDPTEMYLTDICSVSVNISGVCALDMPCGFDSVGMPIGMQLIGKPMDECTLLRAGYAFEQNTDFHKVRPKL